MGASLWGRQKRVVTAGGALATSLAFCLSATSPAGQTPGPSTHAESPTRNTWYAAGAQ